MPLAVAKKSARVLELAEQVIRHGNISALSDGASGAALATAAILSAEYNIRINCKQLPANLTEPILAELADIKQRAAEIESRIHTALHERGL